MITTTINQPIIPSSEHITLNSEPLPINTDQYRDSVNNIALHEPIAPKKEDSLTEAFKQLSQSKLFNSSIDNISYVLLASLFGASFCESKIIKVPEKFTKGLSRFADLANRVFQALNSTKNLSQLYPRKDYLNALGHAGDWVALAVSNSQNHYNDRGWLSLCWYILAHSINIMNEKDEFTSLDDHLHHLKLGFQKIKKNFFSEPSKFFSRLVQHEHSMMGVLASALCFTGGIALRPLSAIFGQVGRGIAATMRSAGGIFQALEAMKPGHIISGRIFFGLSGYAQALGAVSNIFAETIGKDYKRALDPLSFALSSLGRILYRMSNDNKEAGLTNKPFSFTDFKNNLTGAFGK